MRAAAAFALTAQGLAEPSQSPRWTTCTAPSTPDPNPGRIDPWGAGLANPNDPHAAEQSSGDLPPPLPRAKHLNHPIRSQRPRLDQLTPSIQSVRSRSNGQKSPIPLRPRNLAKEPLSFWVINPHSFVVQKYLQFSPVSFTEPPELSNF